MIRLELPSPVESADRPRQCRAGLMERRQCRCLDRILRYPNVVSASLYLFDTCAIPSSIVALVMPVMYN